MDDQEAMAIDNQGNQNSNGHAIQALDNNGHPQTHGTVSSSSGEILGVQNVITTVMSSTNGSHSTESVPERNSPDTQVHNQNQMTPTSISPNPHCNEIDVSHVKVEQPEAMPLIIKQEVISSGHGGKSGRFIVLSTVL